MKLKIHKLNQLLNAEPSRETITGSFRSHRGFGSDHGAGSRDGRDLARPISPCAQRVSADRRQKPRMVGKTASRCSPSNGRMIRAKTSLLHCQTVVWVFVLRQTALRQRWLSSTCQSFCCFPIERSYLM